MKKISEYDNYDIYRVIGAQPHRLTSRKDKHSSRFKKDSEPIDKIHDKYSRSERRSFIQVATKIYSNPVVH